MPHDRLFSAQLRRNCVDEDGADADHSIPGPIPEDHGAESRVLRFGGVWEHFAAVFAGVV